MKKLPGIILLIIGMATSVAIAQKADSVIVIYDNQQTIIPLPAFGSQTSVSYADSNKVIEIGVWLRKPGETSPFPQFYSNNPVVSKPKNKSKWFSQVEVGYITKSIHGDGVYSYLYFLNGVRNTYSENYSVGDRKGYQIRLSVQEKEFYLNRNFSFISGFKLGFSQSYLHAQSIVTIFDENNEQIDSYDKNYKIRVNNFQFLYQFGISYLFNAEKLPVRISMGNSMGILKFYNITNYPETHNAFILTSLLQPYLGIEISKIGVLYSMDFAVPFSPNYILHSNLGGNISVALTYRVF